MNGSAWSTALRNLGDVVTSVAMVQEHRLRGPERLRQAEAKLGHAGWRAAWSEAAPTERKGA